VFKFTEIQNGGAYLPTLLP